MNAKQLELDEKEYEHYLNEVYSEVSICGIPYSAGYALKCVDETAFDVGMADHNDSLPWACSKCDTQHDEESDAEECCVEDEEEKEE